MAPTPKKDPLDPPGNPATPAYLEVSLKLFSSAPSRIIVLLPSIFQFGATIATCNLSPTAFKSLSTITVLAAKTFIDFIATDLSHRSRNPPLFLIKF